MRGFLKVYADTHEELMSIARKINADAIKIYNAQDETPIDCMGWIQGISDRHQNLAGVMEVEVYYPEDVNI
jgi:hypothetical protein